MNIDSRFEKLYAILDAKKEVINNLKNAKYRTKGIFKMFDANGNIFTCDLSQANDTILTMNILPYLVSVRATNAELNKQGLSPVKIDNNEVQDLIEDVVIAISKNRIPELKKEYKTYLSKLDNISPESLRVNRVLDELDKDLGKDLTE